MDCGNAQIWHVRESAVIGNPLVNICMTSVDLLPRREPTTSDAIQRPERLPRYEWVLPGKIAL